MFNAIGKALDSLIDLVVLLIVFLLGASASAITISWIWCPLWVGITMTAVFGLPWVLITLLLVFTKD